MTFTLADIKRRVTAGTRWTVTNHYIQRTDHPCFGTRTLTVTKANGSAFYIPNPGDEHDPHAGRIEWPKASQVELGTHGEIRLYGGGCSQAPTDLFLTLRPAH